MTWSRYRRDHVAVPGGRTRRWPRRRCAWS